MTTAATSPGAAPQEGKTAPDWEAIELAYRAGVLSVREVAKQHGVSHVAIQKKAKGKGWARDLSARVRKAVTTQLVTSEVTVETEQAAVEQAAATIVSVVREHRRDIAKLRGTGDTLWQQLVDAIGSREALEELIREETEVDGDAPASARAAASAKRAAMLKAVSLPQHIASLKDLATVMRSLVPLERQAFSVDEPPPPGGPVVEAVVPGLAPLLAKLEAIVPQR